MELAKAKAALERRLAKLERRLEILKLALTLVEEKLERGSAAGQRGGAASVALSQSAPRPAAGAAEKLEIGELGSKLWEEVLVWGGAELARFTVYERGLVIEPLIEVPAGSPHLLNTLVLKVLNEYRREDELEALRGGLKYGERLSYAVAEEAGLVKRIVVRNWREKERLEESGEPQRWRSARSCSEAEPGRSDRLTRSYPRGSTQHSQPPRAWHPLQRG
jgi:hypothetical protein